MYSSAVAFIVALTLTLIGVPIARRLAIRFGLVDHPDKKRKLHSKAIPLVGGITVFFMALAAIAVAFPLAPYLGETTGFEPDDGIQLWGLLIAAGLLLFVGFIDDRFGLRGRQKLIGQIVVATILIAVGYSFEMIKFMGFEIHLGHFALIVMYVWILGGINSVNLLDGADGFATSLGVLMSGGLCVMALANDNHVYDAIIAAAMCGALLAFLRFNFPPASAYLGDAGSMLIGLMVAALAIRSASKQPMAYAFFAPLALLAIPMIDTLAAIIRRRLTGKSIYSTDRGHIHHALMRRGLSPRLALLWFSMLCLTTVVGATLSLIYRQSEYALISIIAVIVFLIAGKVFGFAEFKLVSKKAMSYGKSFLVLGSREKDENAKHSSIQLQGDRNWEVVWQSVREFSEKHHIDEITMDLDLPWIHESFHATYRDPKNGHETGQWSAEVPVQLKDRLIGRLLVKANIESCNVYEVVPLLIDAIESLQPNLMLIIERRLDSHHEAESAHEIEADMPMPPSTPVENEPIGASPMADSS